MRFSEVGDDDDVLVVDGVDDADLQIYAISASSGGRLGNVSRAGSARRVRGEGAGPRGRVASGWKAGQGREGSVCLGTERGGMGPCTRRREEGGGRRGMVITLQIYF
jgi:hypothetical protein